jgi:ATP-dependent protease HslVU (ClpYQ) ATPase subunit
MLEMLLEPEMFGAPDTVQGVVRIDAATVRERLGPVLDDPERRSQLV